nr:site-2 protease family protein [Hyphomicrobium methylovorum]
MFANIWFLLKELLRVPVDILLGTARRSYVVSAYVAAPKDICWDVISAHKIRLEGSPSVELDTEPDASRPGVYVGVCKFDGRSIPFAYQIVDERDGEALTVRLLTDESDPIYHLGEDYLAAVALVGDERNAMITNTCELTHTRFFTRLIMPLTVLRNISALKRTAEARAGTSEAIGGKQIKNALITGALTFASFFALFGGSIAISLLIVILLHEIGHVIAMRWAGITVRGIYFLPFFGGVAVGESAGSNQLTRGLVALMGPGFSMLPTSVFLLLSLQNGDPTLTNLALISALLNGFNLLPIMPLDGGRVLEALMSRIGNAAARAVHAITMSAGIGLAAVFGDYLLVGLLLIIAPSILRTPGNSDTDCAPLNRSELAWLTIAYIAVFVFYIAVTMQIWAGTPLPAD